VVWTRKSIYKMEKVVHNFNISCGLEVSAIIILSPYDTILPEVKGMPFLRP